MTLEDLARRRVEGDDQLAPYAPILLKDWHPGHYDWVATGNGDDLLTWAKTLEVAQRLLERPARLARGCYGKPFDGARQFVITCD